MDAEKLNGLLERLRRLRRRLSEKAGGGMSWSAKTSDCVTHRYIVNGLKDFDQIGDDAEGMFVWLWSFKDYLKAYARSRGKSAKWVEAEAIADPCLSVCADLANRAKHGNLGEGKSKSGK